MGGDACGQGAQDDGDVRDERRSLHVIEFGGGDLFKRMIPLVGAGRIAGVDFSPEMVEACTRRFDQPIRTGRMELRCASAENLP